MREHETKAARIRRLYADGMLTTTEIARIVGCNSSYVRTAAKHRGEVGNNHEREHKKRFRNNGDNEAARAAGRAAYRNAKEAGHSTSEAAARYISARDRVLRQTAREARNG